MASESIAHEAEGRMGYWLRAHLLIKTCTTRSWSIVQFNLLVWITWTPSGMYDQKEKHFSTCCHSDHVFHKINSSHHLSDGMFYLQASVHFQEVEILLWVNQALNSASRVISDFLSKSYSLLTHGFSHVWVHKWTARKQMLVFSLTIHLYDCLGLRTNIVTL